MNVSMHHLSNVLFLAILLMQGCSRGPSMGELHGQALLDGKLIEKGSIRLVPVDGEAPTAGSVIENGKFNVRLAPAQYRVEISATQLPPGGIPKDVNEDYTIRQLIPAKYNTNSEVVLDIKPGVNEHKFDLTSR
jgi:hypothetical protein